MHGSHGYTWHHVIANSMNAKDDLTLNTFPPMFHPALDQTIALSLRNVDIVDRTPALAHRIAQGVFQRQHAVWYGMGLEKQPVYWPNAKHVARMDWDAEWQGRNGNDATQWTKQVADYFKLHHDSFYNEGRPVFNHRAIEA